VILTERRGSKYEHNLLYIRLDVKNSVAWGEKLQLKADCYTNNYNRSTAQAILDFSIVKMKSVSSQNLSPVVMNHHDEGINTNPISNEKQRTIHYNYVFLNLILNVLYFDD